MGGLKKYIGVVGETGESVRVLFKVKDGTMQLLIDQEEMGGTVFRSMSGSDGQRYSILGSFSDNPVRMETVGANKFRGVFTMRDAEYETFIILKDEDSLQAIHPEMEFAALHQSKAVGPDHQAKGLSWFVDLPPGAQVSVVLDLDVTDRKAMVTWEE